MTPKIGDKVEIQEWTGNKWEFTGVFGTVTAEDRHCFTVLREDGEEERDIREHYRVAT